MKKQTTVLNILIVLVIAIALTLVFVETPLSDLKTVPVILPAASPDDGDGEDEEEALKSLVGAVESGLGE